jgi:hypothetical protein
LAHDIAVAFAGLFARAKEDDTTARAVAFDDHVQQVPRGLRVHDLYPRAPVEDRLIAKPTDPTMARPAQQLLERVTSKAGRTDLSSRSRVHEDRGLVTAQCLGRVERLHELTRAAAPAPVAPHERLDHGPLLSRTRLYPVWP